MSFGRPLIKCLLLAVALCVLGIDLDALAIPGDPAPRPTLAQGADRPMLVARARRRRGRAKPAPRPKAKTKAAPKVEDPDDTPSPSPAGGGAPQMGAAAATDPGNLQRGGRVEFDGRLVQGQTAKSGAIYLFARQRTDLRSMVRERETYRREVLRTVYPDWDKQ